VNRLAPTSKQLSSDVVRPNLLIPWFRVSRLFLLLCFLVASNKNDWMASIGASVCVTNRFSIPSSFFLFFLLFLSPDFLSVEGYILILLLLLSVQL